MKTYKIELTSAEYDLLFNMISKRIESIRRYEASGFTNNDSLNPKETEAILNKLYKAYEK